MQGLLALIPLVLQVLPKLAPIFGTPLSGGILDKAGQVAKEVFGTIDAAQVQLQLEQEKSKADRQSVVTILIGYLGAAFQQAVRHFGCPPDRLSLEQVGRTSCISAIRSARGRTLTKSAVGDKLLFAGDAVPVIVDRLTGEIPRRLQLA